MPQNLSINLKMTTFHCAHSCLQTEDPQNLCLIYSYLYLLPLPTLFWIVQMLNCIRTLHEPEKGFLLFISYIYYQQQSSLAFEPALSPQEFLPPNLPYHHRNFYPTICPVTTGISTPQSALSPQEFLPHNRPYHHRNSYPQPALSPQEFLPPQSALSLQTVLPHNEAQLLPLATLCNYFWEGVGSKESDALTFPCHKGNQKWCSPWPSHWKSMAPGPRRQYAQSLAHFHSATASGGKKENLCV